MSRNTHHRQYDHHSVDLDTNIVVTEDTLAITSGETVHDAFHSMETWTLATISGGLASFSGGVSDHGSLTGLEDDDHTQYVRKTTLTTKGDILVRDGTQVIRMGAGTNGSYLMADSAAATGLAWTTVSGGDGGNTVGQFIAGWDGGGSEITAGTQVDVIAPFDGEITGWKLLADQAGAAVVDVWLDVIGNFPPTNADSITGATPPTLSAATNASSTDVADWDSSVTTGDILRFNLDSVDAITRLLCVIDYER
jgi:hypothetical protein